MGYFDLGLPNYSGYNYSGYPSVNDYGCSGNSSMPIYQEESQARKDLKFFTYVAIAGLVLGALCKGKPKDAKAAVEAAKRRSSSRLSRLSKDTVEISGKKGKGFFRRLFSRKPKSPTASAAPSSPAAAAGEAKEPGFFRRLFSRKKPVTRLERAEKFEKKIAKIALPENAIKLNDSGLAETAEGKLFTGYTLAETEGKKHYVKYINGVNIRHLTGEYEAGKLKRVYINPGQPDGKPNRVIS